jgi:penicillin-binding protein 1C
MKLPPPLRRFGAEQAAGAAPTLRILFPPDGAQLERMIDEGKALPLPVKIGGGKEPLTLLVNGMPLPRALHRRNVFLPLEQPGFLRLTVIDLTGKSDSVNVRVR